MRRKCALRSKIYAIFRNMRVMVVFLSRKLEAFVSRALGKLFLNCGECSNCTSHCPKMLFQIRRISQHALCAAPQCCCFVSPASLITFVGSTCSPARFSSWPEWIEPPIFSDVTANQYISACLTGRVFHGDLSYEDPLRLLKVSQIARATGLQTPSGIILYFEA